MNLRSSIFLTIWILLCSSNTVQAADEQTETNGGASDPIEIYRDAGANEAQTERIKTLAEQMQSVNADRAREIMGLIRDIKNLSLQPDLDEKKLLADQTRINNLQAAMALERTKLLIKVRKLLTPPQREKLVVLMRQRRDAGSQQ